MTKRVHWVDICKGMTIILVVIGHVVSSFHNSGKYIDTDFFNHVGGGIYSFHMPLFFVISGYLSSRRINEKTKIKNKTMAYGIPYVIFSIVAVLLKVAAKEFVNSSLGFRDILWIFVYPINSLWFIYSLLLISLIHELLKPLLKQHIWKLVILVISYTMMAFAIFVERGRIFADSWVVNSIFIDVCKYMFWFEAGVLLTEKLVTKIEEVTEKKMSVIALMTTSEILTFIVVVVLLINHNVNNLVSHTLLAIFGCALSMQLAIIVSKSVILEFLGRSTMEIYILHTYVVSLCRVGLIKMHLTDPNGIIPLVLCSIAGLVIPIAFYQTIKRVKFIDFCFYPKHYI